MVQITYKLAKSLKAPSLGLTGTTADLERDFNGFGTNVFDSSEVLRKKVDSQDTRIALDFVRKIARDEIGGRAGQITKIVQKAADTAMSNFFVWVAANFLSGADTTIQHAALMEAGVTWAPLTPRYLDEKAALQAHSGYWQFTGSLFRQFNSRNSRRREMFGPTTVKVRTRGFVSTLNISLGSALEQILSEGGDRFTSSQRLEKELINIGFGGNEIMVRKLQGRLSHYRPLLGPALSYYIKHVVEDYVVKELGKAGFKYSRLSNRSVDLGTHSSGGH